LGYTRFDYRIGENIHGWSISVGLRYQFTPGPTGRGFDLARSLPRPPPVIGAMAGRSMVA